MRALTLGILAHVDAGKTSLTEQFLYSSGAIKEIGSVNEGSTQTDSLTLERKRGITIRSAVVSFIVDGITINLIDTPGHPDFIAEVERVLTALDGAVLVVSAVEGVQAQTRMLMRTLQRLHVPTLIFVNKIDRAGAEPERVLKNISEKLTSASISMGAVTAQGMSHACYVPHSAKDPEFVSSLTDLLTERDETLLRAYIEDEAAVSHRQLHSALATQTKAALVHPVFYGSAITGAGVESLTTGIKELLPTTDGDSGGTVIGSVFKIERGPAGEKIAFVRMFAGTINIRDRLTFRQGGEGKVSAINAFERGSAVQSSMLAAGQIGKLWGLDDIQIGDTIGPSEPESKRRYFAPPTLETVIEPRDRSARGALHVALSQLAEQDPLINLRQDDIQHEMFVSLYGEVQKEIIQATLANDFGIEVAFRETTLICIERPAGTGAAVETAPNPFIATIGLRVDPAAVGSGVQFRVEVDRGSLPLAFFKAVEDTVHETLKQGLYGWQVTDCTVAMTQSIRYRDFASSTAAEHRYLTPLVLMSALRRAGTKICEPMHRFYLEAPADSSTLMLSVLARLQAETQTSSVIGSSYSLSGEIPASRVHELQQLLPSLTHGEGILECVFKRYQPVSGKGLTRPRIGPSPLNRKEYLMSLTSSKQ